MGIHPLITQRDQRSVGHLGLGRQRPRQTPIAIADSSLGVRPVDQPPAAQNRSQRFGLFIHSHLIVRPSILTCLRELASHARKFWMRD